MRRGFFEHPFHANLFLIVLCVTATSPRLALPYALRVKTVLDVLCGSIALRLDSFQLPDIARIAEAAIHSSVHSSVHLLYTFCTPSAHLLHILYMSGRSTNPISRRAPPLPGAAAHCSVPPLHI